MVGLSSADYRWSCWWSSRASCRMRFSASALVTGASGSGELRQTLELRLGERNHRESRKAGQVVALEHRVRLRLRERHGLREDPLGLQVHDQPLGLVQLGIRIGLGRRRGEPDRGFLVAGVINDHGVALANRAEMT